MLVRRWGLGRALALGAVTGAAYRLAHLVPDWADLQGPRGAAAVGEVIGGAAVFALLFALAALVRNRLKGV